MAFHPTILSGFQQMQTDLGDTRLNHYILEHSFRWLTGDSLHARFWNPPFFYPQTNVAAYTDILVGAAPLYWLWRGLGVDPDTSFQIWMLAVMSLNFLAAYLWLRRGLRWSLHLEPLAASVGAFIFAYGSARVAQLSHQQLLPHFYTIAALYALTRILSPTAEGEVDAVPATGRRTTAWIVVLFASVTLQLYAGFYLGWFLLLALQVATVWLLLLALCSPGFRRRAIPRLWSIISGHWRVIAAASLASAAILAPMALHYLSAGKEVGYRDFDQETISMAPRILSWLNVGYGSWLYGRQASLAQFVFPAAQEHRLGLGFVTTLTAAAGFWWGIRQRPWLRFVAVCALTIGVVVTLFPGGFTPWRYLHGIIPGADAIRALARIGILMLIPAGLGVALGIQWILNARASGSAVPLPRAKASTLSTAFAAGLAMVCVAEQGRTTGHHDKFKSRAQVESIVGQIGSGSSCEAFFFSPLMQPGQLTEDWKFQVDAMWAQMLSGVPTVNGYSGNDPPGWDLGDNRLRSPADESRMRGALDRWATAKRLDPARICWVRMPMGD